MSQRGDDIHHNLLEEFRRSDTIIKMFLAGERVLLKTFLLQSDLLFFSISRGYDPSSRDALLSFVLSVSS